jgi:hypothetical protein
MFLTRCPHTKQCVRVKGSFCHFTRQRNLNPVNAGIGPAADAECVGHFCRRHTRTAAGNKTLAIAFCGTRDWPRLARAP